MARVLIVLFLVAAAAVWFYLSPYRPRTLAEKRAARLEDAQADRLLARSVRLLEAGLNDPMYRQTAAWEESARGIVSGYYEGD